jgi:hypothetical protein
MKRSPRPRKTATLSESVHHQLNMYAFAASAAALGVLAVAQAAEAKIVYTPVHRVIGPNRHDRIDLDHNGVSEFTIINSHFMGSNRSVNWVWARASSAGYDGVAAGSGGLGYFPEQALRKGTVISGRLGFENGAALMAGQCLQQGTDSAPPCDSQRKYNAIGPWVDVRDHYLGLIFHIHGEVHYGWARLNVELSRKPLKARVTLTGYAYETTPNKPIIAGRTEGSDDASIQESNAALSTPTPRPATLGALALGAPGLSIWRRKESVGATQ